MSHSLRSHGLQPTGLLCPWNFPGKSTGVGCHFLLQRIFPTQGSNPGLPHCRQMLYRLCHQGISLFFVFARVRHGSSLILPSICLPRLVGQSRLNCSNHSELTTEKRENHCPVVAVRAECPYRACSRDF